VKTCHDALYTVFQEQDVTPLCVLLCHQIAGTFNIDCNTQFSVSLSYDVGYSLLDLARSYLVFSFPIKL